MKDVRALTTVAFNVLLPSFASVLALAVLTRQLPPSEYGDIAVSLSVAATSGVIAYGWNVAAIARFLPGSDKATASAITVLARNIAWFTTVLLILAAGVLAPFSTVAALGLCVAGAALPLNVRLAAERSLPRLGQYSMWNLIQIFGSSVVPPFVALWSPHAGPVIASMVVVHGIASIASGLPGRHNQGTPWPKVPGYFLYGLPLTASSAALVALNHADRLIIALYRGSQAAGLYAAGFSLYFRGYTIVAAALQHFLAPEFARAADLGNERRVRRLFLGGIIAALAAGGIGVAVAWWLPTVPQMVLGSEYRGLQRTFYLGSAFAGFCYVLYAVLVQGLAIDKKSRTIAANISVSALATIIVTTILVASGTSIAWVPWLSAGGYFIAASGSHLARLSMTVRRKGS